MRAGPGRWGQCLLRALFVVTGLAASAVVAALPARAHCDTLDGPVVAAARLALQKGDVTPALRWVGPGQEAEIRAAFDKALKVRAAGPDARELADVFFFETLVRLHRAGEGASYEGLKPAGTVLEPGVRAADVALGTGDVGRLVKLVAGDVDAGIRQRWARVIETRKHADQSVDAGREYVAAYVEFVHYVERVHGAATGGGAHRDRGPSTPAEAAAHEH